MVNSILSFATVALAVIPASVLAAPTPEPWAPTTHFPVVDAWLQKKAPGKWHVPCTDANIKVRKDFDSMAPAERKAYTDAVNCLRSKPSELNQTLYPAATDRYMDYAVTHVNRTKVAHLSGFFLTWHRYFLHLYEEDLRNTCGYTGSFPYWNWPATADNLAGSPIFDGSEYSMSGNGLYTNSDPIVLAPGFAIPHGSGGGCVTTGPFAGMDQVLNSIPTSILLTGADLPPNAFALNKTCLTRDLNTFAAQTWCNYTAVELAVETTDIATFSDQINGIIGGGSLGIHSGAHFIMGSPASDIFVSAQDPIWYPLHAMLDRVFTSWQTRHPDVATTISGTETALNLPPSANVTLDTIEPDWGYFDESSIKVGELMSTTSGPFCYKYDTLV